MPDSAADRLRHLGAFEKSLTSIDWFGAAGTPLGDAERKNARFYIDGLKIGGKEIENVPGWLAARDITQRHDWSPDWWEREEAERKSLTAGAGDCLGANTLHTRLSGIGRTASDVLQEAATGALDRAGISDPGLGKSAAGAATMAVGHAALALADGKTGEHPFAAKFRLYQAGRWPLGLYDGTFYLL